MASGSVRKRGTQPHWLQRLVRLVSFSDLVLEIRKRLGNVRSMKRRIKENAWGNWYGYEGTKRVIEFGTDERDANEWLANPEKYLTEKKELSTWLTRNFKRTEK